jgi:hypothetical protein
LSGCADCRAELESQRALRDAVNIEVPTPDPEVSLAKVLRRLDVNPASQTPGRGHGLGWILGTRRPMPAWAGLALALQLGIVVVFGLTLYRVDHEFSSYHTLASANAPVPAKGNLVVVFEPQTQLRAMQAILVASGARIVDGPLTSGGYVLQAPPASLSATLAWLRTQRNVAMVERLDSQGAR